MVRHNTIRSHMKRGFTLVELIVVIAVLAILALIVTPHYVRYVAEAKKVACEVELTQLQKAIVLEFADSEASEDALSFWQTRLPDILPAGGVSCCVGGTVSVVVDDDSAYPRLQCDLVGDSGPIITGSNLDKIYNALNAMDTSSGFGRVWDTYWATRLRNGASIDSGATWQDSHAQQLMGYILETTGIDLSEGAWRMYRLENSDQQMFNIFWTDVDIATLPVGSVVSATRYDAINNEYVQGTMKIGTSTYNQETYPILTGNSFVPAS